MEKTSRIGIGLILVLFFLPCVAHGEWVDVKVCFTYQINFDDVSYGDYYTTNDDKPAYGIWARIEVGPIVVYNDYTESEGDDAGCIESLSMNTNYTYKVTVKAQASLDDNNYTKVWKNDDKNEILSQVITDSYSPTSSTTEETFRMGYTTGYKTSNVLAASGKALDRRPAGLYYHVYEFFPEDCPGVGGSCWSIEGLYIDSDDRDEKFTITHEMGHEIMHRLADTDDYHNDCSHSAILRCSSSGEQGHNWHSKEFMSCAAIEGFSDFYAAAAFNDDSEYDCSAGVFEGQSRNCGTEGKILQDFCFGPRENKGVQADWVNFWWDLYHFENLSVAQIADIYVDVLPDISSWSDSQVYYGLKISCVTTNGYITSQEWDDWEEENGINN